MNHKFSKILPSMGVMAMLLSAPAYAQSAPNEEAESDEGVIVVTGTLIRGVRATGSQRLALDAEAIAQQGPQSTNELLASIPQVGQFNGRFESEPRGNERGYTINRPNLRGLPGFADASGSVTLVLMNGHHLGPVGTNESAIDPDIIPAAVVERVEVVTDGGSSIYGADAVGGVINFITRREFNGVQLDGNYGFGDTIDGFQQWDTTLTAGTSWEGGNGYISVGTSSRDRVTNGETEWSRLGIWQPNGSLSDIGTECRNPVGTETRWFWFGSGWTNNPAAPGAGVFSTGAPNCNQFAESTLLPQNERDNVFASITQDVADNIEFRATAYYTKRTLTFADYPLGFTSEGVSGPPSTPGTFTGQIVALPGGTGFSFEPHAAYRDRDHETWFETFGIAPELNIDLGSDWQLRNTLFYGRSNNSQIIPRVNRTLAQDYIDSGDLDPFDVASADASVIQDILDWEQARETNQDLFNFRTIADGPVMDLPAGPLRVALGFEFANTSARSKVSTGRIGAINDLDFEDASRNLYSVFGEVSIPVANALDLSLSLRHDDYSDFGKTTNPNIGFDLHPVEWFSIYGHWGKSFNAPTVLDEFAIATAVVNANNSAAVINGMDINNVWPAPGDDTTRNDVLQATGDRGDLDPQTSEQWSIGFNADPIDGLRLNLNYYEITFENVLGATNPIDPRAIAANQDKFIWNPTQAQFDAFIAELDNQSELSSLNANDFALILDRVTDNIDNAYLTGIDFSINYSRATDWGLFDIGLSGNHQIQFDLNGVDFLKVNSSDLSMQGMIGWRRDNLSTRVTVNYTGGFDTNNAQNGQTSVDSFTTTNLFVGYDIPREDGAGTSLRFLVDNVFDADPPLWRRNAQNLSYAGFTLGRVFKVGVTQNF